MMLNVFDNDFYFHSDAVAWTENAVICQMPLFFHTFRQISTKRHRRPAHVATVNVSFLGKDAESTLLVVKCTLTAFGVQKAARLRRCVLLVPESITIDIRCIYLKESVAYPIMILVASGGFSSRDAGSLWGQVLAHKPTSSSTE